MVSSVSRRLTFVWVSVPHSELYAAMGVLGKNNHKTSLEDRLLTIVHRIIYALRSQEGMFKT